MQMTEHKHVVVKFGKPHDCSSFLANPQTICAKNVSGRTIEIGSPKEMIMPGQSFGTCLDNPGIQRALDNNEIIIHNANESAASEPKEDKSAKKQKPQKSENTPEPEIEQESSETVAQEEPEPSVQLETTDDKPKSDEQ
jgi:hypothetical protein